MKRLFKRLIRNIFYKLRFDLIYLNGQDNLDNLVENSKYIYKASDLDIYEAVKTMVPVGCNKKLIRIGGNSDGAYLLPKDLAEIDACFSPGTSNTKSFEDQLVNDYGIKCFMSDASVKKSSLFLKEGFQYFQELWIGDFDSKKTRTLSSWIKKNNFQNSDKLLLQMDIEGSEYKTILSTAESDLKRFKILIIEFHDLQRIRNSRFLNFIFQPVMKKLLSFFDCVHAHANNACGYEVIGGIELPRVIELTFYRKDLNIGTKNIHIPHEEDVLNDPKLPPILLGSPWTDK